MSESVFLTIPEVAATLGISTAQCYRLLRAGTLPAIRRGRRYLVHRAMLARYVQEGTKDTTPSVPLPPTVAELLRELTRQLGDVEIVLRPRQST